MKYRTGLTLGTYAPFHRGHQFVIDTALAECSDVWVMIYDDPERTNVPLFTRANWVRQQYPFDRLHIIQCWDGPTTLGYTPEIIKLHDDYIRKTMIAHRVGSTPNEPRVFRVNAFYSSEPYGEHVSAGLQCVNRPVDPPRIKFPVSGTKIRQDPPSWWEYVSPHVHRDLITKVVLLGAPSTGKTTLAQALAEHWQTQWVPEYGREYWDKNNKNRRLTRDDLLAICHGHVAKEGEAIAKARDWLFIDTNALTTRLFDIYYHGHSCGLIDEFVDRCASRYDMVFLCGDEIPYDDTADRSGEANRRMFQRMIIEDLKVRRIPYHPVAGTLPQRVAVVNDALINLKPRR